MTTATVAGLPLLSAEIRVPLVGAWHADIAADGATALAGRVEIAVDGVTFSGTVVPGRSGVSGGRLQAVVVGGAGGLSKALPAKNYAHGVSVGASVRTVVGDILRECGETLSPTSSTDVLAKFLGKWERSADLASRGIADVLEKAGASWRVLNDGTIWVGVDTFPDQEIEHVLEDEDWTKGVLDVAPAAPDLRPGVTFHGQRITYVKHTVGTALRTEAYVTGSPGNIFERLFRGIRREIDYSRKYLARVVSQGADGTLSVVPDDERIRGRGMDKVAIRTGLPGSVKVPQGARVMVGFDGGDPAKPYAEGWDGTTFTEVQIGNGTLPAARQGDMVLCGGPTTAVILTPVPPGVPAPPNAAIAAGMPCLMTFVQLPPTATLPPISTPSPYLPAVVSSGNQQIKE